MKPVWIEFSPKGDARGGMYVLESEKNLPFTLKRVYYILDVPPETSRGFHAHKALEQVAVCMKGSCKMILDDGKDKGEFLLDSPSKGLYIGNMIWREMHDFTEDALLVVFASEYYEEEDYIRDYNEFLSTVT